MLLFNDLAQFGQVLDKCKALDDVTVLQTIVQAIETYAGQCTLNDFSVMKTDV